MAKQQHKPQPQAVKKTEQTPAKILLPLLPDTLTKKIFYGLSAVLFVWMVATSHQYGISGDENFHRVYGHHIINFYATLGEDTTAATTNGPDSLMVFYGGFYDGTATLLSKAMPSVNEWDVRHGWNSMFGWLAMFCAGLVAVEVAGWQAGLITLIFMMFSPRFFGESMNNPKDITMAAGYMLSYVFIIKFLKQLPKPSIKIALGLGASIAVAMGIRIGGLLLIPYAWLFFGLAILGLYGFGGALGNFKENVWPGLRMLLLATVIGYFGSLVFWPYGMVSPIDHPLEALGVAQKFPVQLSILFAGEHIRSTEVPWNYIPRWMLIITPLFGLVGLLFSFGLIPDMIKQKKVLLLGFLYFTLAFPIAYVIYQKAVLYDSMRHLFFVYPSIIILAALAFDYALKIMPKAGKYVTLGVMLVLVFLPARFMFANHPNEYVYFNELQGGIKGAFGYYETDYYMNSVKQCVDWIHAHENLKRTDGRETRVYSNAITPVTEYMRQDTANISIGYTSYRNRCNPPADYLILYCRFIDKNILRSGAFPMEQSVYTVYADGVPLSCVVRKDDKRDYEGQELMGAGNYAGAIALLEPYAAKYPNNDVVLNNLGLCYLNVNRYEDAIKVLDRAMALNSENLNGGYWKGLALMYLNRFSEAVLLLGEVVRQNPGFAPPYRALAECQMRLGDQQGAAYSMQIYQQLGGGR